MYGCRSPHACSLSLCGPPAPRWLNHPLRDRTARAFSSLFNVRPAIKDEDKIGHGHGHGHGHGQEMPCPAMPRLPPGPSLGMPGTSPRHLIMPALTIGSLPARGRAPGHRHPRPPLQGRVQSLGVHGGVACKPSTADHGSGAHGRSGAAVESSQVKSSQVKSSHGRSGAAVLLQTCTRASEVMEDVGEESRAYTRARGRGSVASDGRSDSSRHPAHTTQVSHSLAIY